jgi:hypothetical protein
LFSLFPPGYYFYVGPNFCCLFYFKMKNSSSFFISNKWAYSYIIDEIDKKPIWLNPNNIPNNINMYNLAYTDRGLTDRLGDVVLFISYLPEQVSLWTFYRNPLTLCLVCSVCLMTFGMWKRLAHLNASGQCVTQLSDVPFYVDCILLCNIRTREIEREKSLFIFHFRHDKSK